MKHVYKKPKAILVDFHYDEKVTANSNIGEYGRYGNQNVGLCQFSKTVDCGRFFNPEEHGDLCVEMSDWSLRP